MNILITGGAGFIGSNLFRYFASKYPKYIFEILDSLTYAGDLNNLTNTVYSDRLIFHHGDIRNVSLVENLVSKADIIINLAGETHVPRSVCDDKIFFETNVIGTDVLVNAIFKNDNQLKKLIHISTSEIYGSTGDIQIDENHILEPQNPYASSKVGADRLVSSHIITHRIPAVIVRPFNQFGFRQHPEKAIPRFITSALLGEPITIYGDGSDCRDYMFVDNLANALEKIIFADNLIGEVFNVGSESVISILNLAEFIKDYIELKTRIKVNISFTEGRMSQSQKCIANSSKLKKLLDWNLSISLEDGLRATIDWYIENPSWWKSKLAMRYVDTEKKKEKI